MAQLLISVKSVKEALLALEAGADIIDLKDPNVGALGALDLPLTKQIVQALHDQKSSRNYDGNNLSSNFFMSMPKISATVGEQHIDLKDLIIDIEARHALGLDMVKIAVSELFYDANFVSKMQSLTLNGKKLVAMFFADEVIDLALLPVLKQANFYGVMLDTKTKQQNLLQMQTKNELQMFTQKCHQHQLQSGFSGSLQPQHIAELTQYNPIYIGFRGGVCDNLSRKCDLNRDKVIEIKKMLLTHNKYNAKPQKTMHLALHS